MVCAAVCGAVRVRSRARSDPYSNTSSSTHHIAYVGALLFCVSVRVGSRARPDPHSKTKQHHTNIYATRGQSWSSSSSSAAPTNPTTNTNLRASSMQFINVAVSSVLTSYLNTCSGQMHMVLFSVVHPGAGIEKTMATCINKHKGMSRLMDVLCYSCYSRWLS